MRAVLKRIWLEVCARLATSAERASTVGAVYLTVVVAAEPTRTSSGGAIDKVPPDGAARDSRASVRSVANARFPAQIELPPSGILRACSI